MGDQSVDHLRIDLGDLDGLPCLVDHVTLE